VTDSHISMVSSNNWVSASFARNRELAAFVDSAQVASYFAHAFDLDWVPDVTSPMVRVSGMAAVTLGDEVTLDAGQSVDDRAIANISWDVWSDGTVDAWGTCYTFVAPVPGTIEFTVIVEDAWGNTAYGHTTVEVALPGADDVSSDGGAEPGLSWAVPLALGAALLLPRLVRRRRDRASARKVNHSRVNSPR